MTLFTCFSAGTGQSLRNRTGKVALGGWKNRGKNKTNKAHRCRLLNGNEMEMGLECLVGANLAGPYVD